PPSPLFPYTTLFRSAAGDALPRPPEPGAAAHWPTAAGLRSCCAALPGRGASLLPAGRRCPLRVWSHRRALAPAALALPPADGARSEEHTSELQSRSD